MPEDRSNPDAELDRAASTPQLASVASSIGDPLREVRVLKRRVQLFVYSALVFSWPGYYFIFNYSLSQMLAVILVGQIIAVAAIEGAFYQMFRLRKRSSYPRLLHQELGAVAGEGAAGAHAMSVIGHLLKVERGCIHLWKNGRPEVHYAIGASLEDCTRLITALKETIDRVKGTGEPLNTSLPAESEDAGKPSPSVVVVPVSALGRATGVLVLEARRGSDLKDTQLLKDIGMAAGLSLESWRQREELSQGEERLKTVVTNVPVVLFAIDKNGVFTLSEGRGLDDLGLKPGEVVGMHVEDVYGDVPQILQDVERALAGERFSDLVEVTGLWWETSFSPVFDQTGEVSGFIGVAANVTARVQAEHELRLTQFSIERAEEAIFWIGPDATILNVNEAACESLGYERDELVGLTIPDIDPVIRGEDWPERWEALRRERSRTLETTHRRKDGVEFPVEISANFIEFNGVEYDLAFARDITARREADRALRNSEAKYRELVEDINDVIYAEDENGIITYVSPAIERVAGYTPEEVIGRSAEDFVHPEDYALLADDTMVEPREFRIFTKSRRERWLRSSLQPIVNEGEEKGLRGVLVDITERRAAEEALRSSEEKYRDLVENSNEVIFTLDPSATVTYISPAVESVGGYKPEEVVGRSSTEFIHPDDMADVAMSLQKVMAGDMDPSEYRLRLKSGEYKWVRSASKPMYEDGKLAGIRGVLVDVTERRQAEEAVRDSERRFRALVENSSDGIALVTEEGKFAYLGPSTSKIVGFDADELIGHDALDLVHPDDVSDAAQTLSQVVNLGISAPGAYRVYHKDGSLRWIEVVTTNLLEEPSVRAIVANYRDITERKLADEALRRSEENHKALALAIPDLMLRVRRDGTVTYHKADDIQALSLPDVKPEKSTLHGVLADHAEQFMRFVDIALSTRESQVFEYQDTVGNVTREFEARIVASTEDEAVAIVRDITERKNAEMTIRQLAYHDSLTGLPNRALFEDRLTMALAQARRSHEMLAVMFLDLDRFKLVNDTLGHSAGDNLLRLVADELTALLREGDTVARVGGDEFTLLLPGITSTADAVEVAGRILARLKTPKRIADREFRVTTSIGITVFPADGDDAEVLLRNADTAMYRAKDRGRDNFQLYTAQMNESVVEKLSLESDLRRALENQEFVVYYQPIADVKTGHFMGAEALVRWNDPKRGLIQPDDFIPFAEETGLIIPLGEWVLREAVNQGRRWIDAGLPDLRLTVNLSAKQLQDDPLVDLVAEVLRESGLPAERLQLEITEGAMMHNVDAAIRTLKELRHLGVGVAVDDFGTGYSSLSYLKRFPVDTVKIDRSFVRDLTIDPNDAAIVTTVLAMARNLGLHVVAEGVETRQQLEFLREHECHEFQGYLLSRPINGEEFIKLVKVAEMARPRRPRTQTPGTPESAVRQ